jgi:putative spermidine/putrescine transport system ATP-binding protein
MSFLVLNKLTKMYGRQYAVDSLSLEVAQGEFVSLLGPSGCGKTTTLQMIAGFVEPDSGSIRLGDVDLRRVRPSRRGLGIVFQSYALFPHMTVSRNVSFGLEMQGVTRGEREGRVRVALNLVGLASFADRYPRQLSGGQQQRVALARALVTRPRVLLLDEPLSNLDAKLREEMQIELREIHKAVGATTILVTHDQAEAMALSDRMFVMNQGRIEQAGTPSEIYERPIGSFVATFLGKTNILPACRGPNGTIAYVTEGVNVSVSIRPERITFVDAAVGRLRGRVSTRVFQGNHWLYYVETEVGPISVVRPNVGDVGPSEGTTVGLHWELANVSVRSLGGDS